MIRMSTINRKPTKTHVYRYDNSIFIDWKCHGIDSNGNRQHWRERTFTHPTYVDTSNWDYESFGKPSQYYTTRIILSPGKFERDGA